NYKDIKTPPLHKVTIEQPKRIQLANGMVIFLMEDHELPLIRGFAEAHGGGRDVSADKLGLASIYAESWRTGGTETKTGDKLDYGANSVYARQSDYATVAAITRDDLLAFHKRFIHPNNIILGLGGDFDAAAMEKKLRAAFESWPKGPPVPHTAPNDIAPAKPG